MGASPQEADGIAEVDRARRVLTDAIGRGAYRSAIDVVLDAVARVIRRGLRLRIAWWFAAILIGLFTLGLSGLVALVAGRGAAFSAEATRHVGVIGLGLCCILVARSISHRFLETLCAHILGALDHADDLASVRKGLAQIFDARKQAIFATIVAIPVAMPILQAALLREATGAIAPEMVVTAVANGWMGGVALYYAFTSFPFLSRVGRFRFRLYRADPASSEVIAALSETAMRVLYTFAALFVAVIFISGRLGLIAGQTGLLWLIGVTWLPLLVVFGGAQWTFTQIIEGAKWRTLTELQDQIHQLEARDPILSTETLEHLGKLMDHHDRVRNTRSTAVDLGAWVGFFNSLLLPVLAFAATNAEAVWARILASVGP